jgi:pimeloyl-[acyl-carrier protein] methyl ester esterase
VVSFDQRGCGQSDKDFTDHSIAASINDTAVLVEKLGLSGAVLNGWSLGGAIALGAASKLGKRCGGLILTCGAAPRYTQAADFPHGGAPADVRALATAMNADRASFFHGLTGGICAKPVSQAIKDWMWAVFMTSGPGVGETISDLADIDQRAILATLDVPVLSVVGMKDAIVVPAIGVLAGESARNGTVVRFEDCGHAPFIEDYAAYIAAQSTFLERLA